eukprot:m.175183 g.175183  ORF g.175183 m.175183 type:complete len:123 (+) comp24398_c0_seq1:529-897(+)
MDIDVNEDANPEDYPDLPDDNEDDDDNDGTEDDEEQNVEVERELLELELSDLKQKVKRWKGRALKAEKPLLRRVLRHRLCRIRQPVMKMKMTMTTKNLSTHRSARSGRLRLSTTTRWKRCRQ